MDYKNTDLTLKNEAIEELNTFCDNEKKNIDNDVKIITDFYRDINKKLITSNDDRSILIIDDNYVKYIDVEEYMLFEIIHFDFEKCICNNSECSCYDIINLIFTDEIINIGDIYSDYIETKKLYISILYDIGNNDNYTCRTLFIKTGEYEIEKLKKPTIIENIGKYTDLINDKKINKNSNFSILIQSILKKYKYHSYERVSLLDRHDVGFFNYKRQKNIIESKHFFEITKTYFYIKKKIIDDLINN